MESYTIGTHPAIPMALYVSDKLMDSPTLNAGTAHRITTDCPYQAWFEHPRLNPNHTGSSSEAADVGSVAHDLLLGGEGKICVIEHKDWRTIEARGLRDAARDNGLTPILAGKIAQCKAMVEIAKNFIARSEIKGVFDQGNAESTVLFEAEGVLCRCRPDHLGREAVIHYKTTKGTANPEKWIRSHLDQDGYALAAAFYELATQREQIFLVQSQAPPYSCSLIALAPSMMEISRFRVARALNLWRTCLNSGKWPSYGARIHYAEPMPWQLAEGEGEPSMLSEEELSGGIPA